MTRAMSRAGIEPIIVEDTLRIGEHRGIAKGAAQATAEATLTLLDARGVSLTAAQRARVRGCADVDALERWFKRALVAATADEVFAAPEGPTPRRRHLRAK